MDRSRVPVQHGDPQDCYYDDESERVPRHRHSRHSSEHGMRARRVPPPRGEYRNDFYDGSEDDVTSVPRQRHMRHSSEHRIRQSNAPLPRGDSRDHFESRSEDDSTRVARRGHGQHSSGLSIHRSSRATFQRGDSPENCEGYSGDDSSRVRRREQCWHSSDRSSHQGKAPLHHADSRDRGDSEDCSGDATHKASKPARRQKTDEAQHMGATRAPRDLSCGRERHRSSRDSYRQEAPWAGGDEQLQEEDKSRVTKAAKKVAKDLSRASDREMETAMPTEPSTEPPLTHGVRRKRRQHAISPATVEHLDKAMEDLDAALKHAEDECGSSHRDRGNRHGDESVERPGRRRKIAESDAANLSKDSKDDWIPRSPSPPTRTDESLVPRWTKDGNVFEMAPKPANKFKKLDVEALQQEKQKLLSTIFEIQRPSKERDRPGSSSRVEESKGGTARRLKDSSARRPAGRAETPSKTNPLHGMSGAAMARAGLIKEPPRIHHSRVEGFNPLGLPMRPSMPICTGYSQTGRCPFGVDCKWDHPPPSTSASTEDGTVALLALEGKMKYDPKTEELLDQWVKAKRTRDFRSADAIRDQLRASGIDPDVRGEVRTV